MKNLLLITLLSIPLQQIIAQQIDGGGYHSLLLCATGEVYAAGSNYMGEIGNAAFDTSWTYQKIHGLENVKQISAGFWHSIALKIDGSVWSWGGNDAAQLVDGASANRFQPLQIDSLNAVIQIGTGGYHTLFLLEDSTVWGGGSNSNGELGITQPPYLYFRPVKVPGLSEIIKVAGGDGFSLALKKDGTVWGFGKNGIGQLGIGNTADSPVPVQVAGLNNVIDISSGASNSYSITSNGTVWSSGTNIQGQLGTGAPMTLNEFSTIPVKVPIDSVVRISSENAHVLALRENGTVWSWGNNSNGQLGDSTTTSRNLPVQVIGLQKIADIATTITASIAIDSGGNIFTWGQGPVLGSGSIVRKRLFPGLINPISCNPLVSSPDSPALQRLAIYLYPNPTSGEFNIKTTPNTSVENIEIFSLTGEVVFKKSHLVENINISQLPKGIYFASFLADGRPHLQKIIKE